MSSLLLHLPIYRHDNTVWPVQKSGIGPVSCVGRTPTAGNPPRWRLSLDQRARCGILQFRIRAPPPPGTGYLEFQCPPSAIPPPRRCCSMAARKESAEASRRQDPDAAAPCPPDAAVTPAFPVVGIGFSAGGLDALKNLFTVLPPDSGSAFVIVPHLDPNHGSLLPTLLARQTAMPVVEATEGMPVAANHVYVLPPNKYLSIQEGI